MGGVRARESVIAPAQSICPCPLIPGQASLHNRPRAAAVKGQSPTARFSFLLPAQSFAVPRAFLAVMVTCTVLLQ